MKTTCQFIAFALLTGTTFGGDLTLWYRQPAVDAPPPAAGQRAPALGLGGGNASHLMNETLPVGNGRLGGLIVGGPARERIVVNEDSLWTGDENPSGNYDSMGAYQVLGDLFVNLPGHETNANYRRDLELDTATAHVSYESGGVKFQREHFCSHPAGVLVARFTADRPGALTGSVELDDSHKTPVVAAGDRLAVAGALSNGMKFAWQVLVQHDGGTLATNGATLEFKNCDRLTLLVAAGTDYVMDYARKYRGADPRGAVTARLDAAARTGYAELKAAHERDFQSLFHRVAVDFGPSTAEQRARPTDRRKLEAVRTEDPELEALLFQYGRYLLISCSRPGGLPANLQGLWNDRNNPPWHCDYHANINIQMNYWPAEVANLSECHLPLFELIQSQLEPWRQATAAAKEFRTAAGGPARRGFAIRTSHNITGGMGWNWDKTANAWYCQHFWEHYAFSQDREFLKTAAYPILRETCEFWQDHLKALPDGKLVVPKAWSPEHGPVEDGVSYSQEIVWDLFNNFVEASDALGADKNFRDQIAALRDRLVTPGIGSWGQLLEWMHEQHNPKYPELDTPNDHHRHTSPLFAVQPGRQISVARTPELAAAAKVLLDARGTDPGSDVREWSFAWRTALYARLHDGENAHRMLQQLFSARNSCPNLFGLHPPMQMDGNFGITAGIAEMLVQSHEGEINLLPALPAAWPDGSVKGLRARGGFTVDLEWKHGKLVAANVTSPVAKTVRLRYGATALEASVKPEKMFRWDGR